MKNWIFGGRDAVRLRLTLQNSIIVADRIDEFQNVQFDCDFNVVVADKPYPDLQGPNGAFFPSLDALKLRGINEEVRDIRPMPDSPLVGAGKDGKTIGPFDPGDELLPRPLEDAWTDSIPDAWKVAA